MPIPLRVPTGYAYARLQESSRGRQRVNLASLEDIAQEGLVQVTHLRPWFNTKSAYLQFKSRIYVPHRYWQAVLEQTNNPRVQGYVKRQMRVNPSHSLSPGSSPHASPRASPRPSRSSSPVRKRYRKGELVMTTKLGSFSPEEMAEAPLSAMYITPAGDECDETDVNLPLPACQAINKVCRNYSRSRQYIPYQPDGTERKNYLIKVKTKRSRA